jgi:hypothetical protein
VFREEIRAPEPRSWFDLSGDGLVTPDDRITWVKEMKNTYFGDANLDGEFNSADLIHALAAGTYEVELDAGWASGDFDGNGRFDSSDLVVALADGGYEQGPLPPAVAALPRAQVNPVPEPSALTYWAIVGLLLIARRARSPLKRDVVTVAPDGRKL